MAIRKIGTQTVEGSAAQLQIILEHDKIYGMADGSNESSLRVLKKLGFEVERVMKNGAGAVVRTVLFEDRWKSLHLQKAQS